MSEAVLTIHFMSFFIPHSWDWSGRDRTKQTSTLLAGAAALGTLGSTVFKGKCHLEDKREDIMVHISDLMEEKATVV